MEDHVNNVSPTYIGPTIMDNADVIIIVSEVSR